MNTLGGMKSGSSRIGFGSNGNGPGRGICRPHSLLFYDQTFDQGFSS